MQHSCNLFAYFKLQTDSRKLYYEMPRIPRTRMRKAKKKHTFRKAGETVCVASSKRIYVSKLIQHPALSNFYTTSLFWLLLNTPLGEQETEIAYAASDQRAYFPYLFQLVVAGERELQHFAIFPPLDTILT